MSAGITVKEFKHIPGVNDAEYIKLLEENSERWKQIANSAIAKLKRMSAERPEIVRCKDCIHRSWDTGKKWPDHIESRDRVCPFLSDDEYNDELPPSDDFYCAYGERKR